MKGLSRRGFLVLGGAAGATAAAAGAVYLDRRAGRPDSAAKLASGATTTTTVASTPGTTAGRAVPAGSRWSDPGSWSDGVPGPSKVAVVTRSIVLDVDARVAGVVVEPSGRLVFDPQASRRLESAGNVVVRGRMAMRPASATVRHRLVMTGAREQGFTGGGMRVLREDVGLWVVDKGVLDLQGAPKRGWTRAAGSVAAGSATIILREDPLGWRPGDELTVAPTLPPGSAGAVAFDTARIKAVRGRTVTLDRPTRRAHPAVDLGADAPGGRVQTAEVANLTRNVAIEGLPGRRAHVFILSSRPQQLRSAVLRHMGPRQSGKEGAEPGATVAVTGRYALHFHMCHDGSRGSKVEGVVVRDAGSRAFVAHESHGVSFRDCVAYDVMEQAYWWDGPPGTSTGPLRDPGTASNDVVYDRCMAALVRADPEYAGFDLAGFTLGRGTGNVCRGCVAVGVLGNVNSCGFQWGENQDGPGIWDFRNNVAHNNARHGIWWWQVTARHHTVFDFAAWRNGGSGILNGAYGDNNHFERCVLVENAETQFFGWAASGQHDPSDPNSSGQATPQHLVDSVMDAGGRSDFACILAGRSILEDAMRSVGQVSGNQFRGARKACVGITFDFHDFGPYLARWRLRNNTYQGNQFWFDDSSHEGAVVETEAGLLRRADQPQGTLKTTWNAKVT